jgi:primosomal protein N''
MQTLKDQLIGKLEELVKELCNVLQLINRGISTKTLNTSSFDKEYNVITNRIEQLESEISALKKEVEEQLNINTPFFGNSGAKYDEAYLNECIEKAKPNLSKIKDADKALDEIRGVYDLQGKESQPVVKMPTDKQIITKANELFPRRGKAGSKINETNYFGRKGFVECAKWLRSQIQVEDLRSELIRFLSECIIELPEGKDCIDMVDEYLNGK